MEITTNSQIRSFVEEIKNGITTACKIDESDFSLIFDMDGNNDKFCRVLVDGLEILTVWNTYFVARLPTPLGEYLSTSINNTQIPCKVVVCNNGEMLKIVTELCNGVVPDNAPSNTAGATDSRFARRKKSHSDAAAAATEESLIKIHFKCFFSNVLIEDKHQTTHGAIQHLAQQANCYDSRIITRLPEVNRMENAWVMPDEAVASDRDMDVKIKYYYPHEPEYRGCCRVELCIPFARDNTAGPFTRVQAACFAQLSRVSSGRFSFSQTSSDIYHDEHWLKFCSVVNNMMRTYMDNEEKQNFVLHDQNAEPVEGPKKCDKELPKRRLVVKGPPPPPPPSAPSAPSAPLMQNNTIATASATSSCFFLASIPSTQSSIEYLTFRRRRRSSSSSSALTTLLQQQQQNGDGGVDRFGYGGKDANVELRSSASIPARPRVYSPEVSARRNRDRNGGGGSRSRSLSVLESSAFVNSTTTVTSMQKRIAWFSEHTFESSIILFSGTRQFEVPCGIWKKVCNTDKMYIVDINDDGEEAEEAEEAEHSSTHQSGSRISSVGSALHSVGGFCNPMKLCCMPCSRHPQRRHGDSGDGGGGDGDDDKDGAR